MEERLKRARDTWTSLLFVAGSGEADGPMNDAVLDAAHSSLDAVLAEYPERLEGTMCFPWISAAREWEFSIFLFRRN